MVQSTSRRWFAQQSLAAGAAVLAGCVSLFENGVDLSVWNRTTSNRTTDVSVTRRDTGETLFESTTELGPDESETFEQAVAIPDQGTTLAIAVSIEGESYENEFSVRSGTDVKGFSVYLTDETPAIFMIRGIARTLAFPDPETVAVSRLSSRSGAPRTAFRLDLVPLAQHLPSWRRSC